MFHQDDGGKHILHLNGDCTIRSIDPIHADLQRSLAACELLEIDLTKVTEADLTLVQAILAACNTAKRQSKTVQLSQPASGVLHDTLVRGGFLTGRADQHEDFWLKPGKM